MTANQQNIVCLVIIVIVVALVGWLGYKPTPGPTGLISLTDSAQISGHFAMAEVKVYQTLPPGSKVIGELTAELALDTSADEQQQVQSIMTYVRERAGAAGANAVVVEMIAQRGQVLYFAGKLATV